MMKQNNNLFLGLICFFLSTLLFMVLVCTARAEQKNANMDNYLGGHLRVQGSVTGYDEDSYFKPFGTATGLDALLSVRLTDKLTFSPKAYFEIHYEAFSQWGDTHEKLQKIKKAVALFSDTLFPGNSNTDKRRLFDLTTTIEETDDYGVWHRLDRLLFSLKPSWGDMIVGRQAVTWGNGLMFNPMDLFNPFAPSDTVHDYKMGDDLVSVRFNGGGGKEWNLLYVPRRDITTGNVEFKKSSVAGKFHFFAADIEMDLMAALHYDEIVLGVGNTGYLGSAAWRWDLVWSTLEHGRDEKGYVQFVANIDYSWVWLQKNMYGLMEYYHNGLGKSDYTAALGNPALFERIDRGELFTLGKNYASVRIQMELHPLFNVYLGVINNLRDPSGIIQPWAVWSLTQNSTMEMGATFYYGGQGSEYGGFSIQGTDFKTNTATNGHLLFTYYF